MKLGESGPNLVIKETFGPYLIDECIFDPLAILQSAYPESRIRVAICFRDIEATADSWSRSFRDLDRSDILSNVGLALFNTYSIYRRARLQELPIILLSPSRFDGFPDPETVADRLRHFFELDRLNQDFSRIRKARDPIYFENPGALDRAKAATYFSYSEDVELNELATAKGEPADFILREFRQALIETDRRCAR